MKEFQEANYARVRRRGPRRSSSDIARAKIQGKRHRVSCCLPEPATFKVGLRRMRPELWFCSDSHFKILTFCLLSSDYWFMYPLILTLYLNSKNLEQSLVEGEYQE